MPARQNLRNCRPKPIAPTRQSQAETCCITHRGASSVIRQPSSRNDFNPNSRTFSIAARIRPTSGFLQVSLSKIRGYIDVGLSCTWLAADFRSTLATSRTSRPSLRSSDDDLHASFGIVHQQHVQVRVWFADLEPDRYSLRAFSCLLPRGSFRPPPRLSCASAEPSRYWYICVNRRPSFRVDKKNVCTADTVKRSRCFGPPKVG